MREQLLEIADEEGTREGLYLPPADPFDDPLPVEDFNLAEGKVSSEVWDLEVGPIIDGSLDQSSVEGMVRATFTSEGPFTRMILKKNGTTIQDNIRHYLLTYQRELLQPTDNPKYVVLRIPQGDINLDVYGKDMRSKKEGYSAVAFGKLTHILSKIKRGRAQLKIELDDVKPVQAPLEPEPQSESESEGSEEEVEVLKLEDMSSEDESEEELTKSMSFASLYPNLNR